MRPYRTEQEHHDRFYSTEAEEVLSGSLMSLLQRRAAMEFLTRTGLNANNRVLSLGCGNGAIECLMARHLRHVVGLDISTAGVAIARKRSHSERLTNLTFEVADLTEPGCEWRKQSFDGVCAFGFLHHLGSDEKIIDLLEAVKGTLRPGGVFYSSDPSDYRFLRPLTSLVQKSYDKYHSPDERELNAYSVAHMLQEVGFVGTQISYSDFFTGPLAWLIPGIPRPLAVVLDLLDRLFLCIPGLRAFASSFSVTARVEVDRDVAA